MHQGRLPTGENRNHEEGALSNLLGSGLYDPLQVQRHVSQQLQV